MNEKEKENWTAPEINELLIDLGTLYGSGSSNLDGAYENS